jgi:hypothetical protein
MILLTRSELRVRFGTDSAMTPFQEHPELELSNNLAENSMRPVALGRRNWIHIGSEEAGPRVAVIVSVVETCRRLKNSDSQLSLLDLTGLGKLSDQPDR